MTKDNQATTQTNHPPSTGQPAAGSPDTRLGEARATNVGGLGGDAETRAPDNAAVLQVLDELLETARDQEFGFQACADEATAPLLQELFYHRAEQCHQAADELVQLIWRFGGTPSTVGRSSGDIDRGPLRISEAGGAQSDQAMLDECEQREDAALARYRRALALDLPPAVRSFVEHQRLGAQRHHDRIRDLRLEGPRPA
ncbi:PA2169 family four-helix-bundle protein [Variovorax defluvii]